MKYIVIGNGILGLSIAFRILQYDSEANITLIGPRQREGGATAPAGAMLNSFAEITEGALKSDAALMHFQLSHMATQVWPDFEEQLIEMAGDNLPDECASCQVLTGGCFSKGTYIINNTTSDNLDDKNFNAIIRALNDFNEQYSMVEPADIPNYEPAMSARALRAIYIPNEGWLNPKIVLKKLDNIMAASSRVNYLDGKVKILKEQGGKIISAVLEDGSSIEADRFIIANGIDASALISRTSEDIYTQPIFCGVGVSLEIRTKGYPHKKVIRTPNRGGACGIYTVPYFKKPDGNDCHILVGASNFVATKPEYKARISSVAHLLHSATHEINQNFYSSELMSVNVGNRPISLDQYPLIGKVECDNLFMVSGTNRDGFHLSPVLSDYLVRIILGKELPFDISIFSPTRQPIRDLSREDAIKHNVDSLMSEQYQHGFVASNIRQVEQLRNDWKKKVIKVHDKVGATDWGIPPLMFKLYRDDLV